MILVKTEAGQLALKDRTVRLTPRQRSAFILFDGKRSADDVIGAGLGVAREDIEQMMVLGLLEPADGGHAFAPAAVTATAPAGAPAASPVQQSAQPTAHSGATGSDLRTPQERYQAAYPIATRLTAGLGLRGFRLNLQVEGTGNFHDLAALAPRIRDAVGAEKASELERALGT